MNKRQDASGRPEAISSQAPVTTHDKDLSAASETPFSLSVTL